MKEHDVDLPSRSHFGDLLHALNQPITGLHCLFEVGLMVQQSSEQQVLLKEGLGLAERMSRIALAMRALLDIEGSPETRGRVDVGKQVKEIAGELQLVAEAAEVRLECNCESDTETTARPEQLRRAWFHTLNAILRRATRGGVVKVGVETAKACPTVCFRWTGSSQEMPAGGHIITENAGNIEDNLDWTLARAAFEREHASWQVVHCGDETILTVVFGRENSELQSNDSRSADSVAVCERARSENGAKIHDASL